MLTLNWQICKSPWCYSEVSIILLIVGSRECWKMPFRVNTFHAPFIIGYSHSFIILLRLRTLHDISSRMTKGVEYSWLMSVTFMINECWAKQRLMKEYQISKVWLIDTHAWFSLTNLQCVRTNVRMDRGESLDKMAWRERPCSARTGHGPEGGREGPVASHRCRHTDRYEKERWCAVSVGPSSPSRSACPRREKNDRPPAADASLAHIAMNHSSLIYERAGTSIIHMSPYPSALFWRDLRENVCSA